MARPWSLGNAAMKRAIFWCQMPHSTQQLFEPTVNKTLIMAVAAAILCASSVSAQLPVSFGVSAGASIPVGDFGDLNDAGFNFGAHARLSMPILPFALRFEVQHNRMKFSGSDANTLVTSGTVNGDYTLGSPIMVAMPYVTAGLGGYYIKTALRGATAGATRYGDVTNFGLNGGFGVRMPLAGFSTFAEARVHWVSTGDEFLSGSATYVPLVFGITF